MFSISMLGNLFLFILGFSSDLSCFYPVFELYPGSVATVSINGQAKLALKKYCRSVGCLISPAVDRTIHTSSWIARSMRLHGEPQVWPKYNSIVYPPQAPTEPRRPAEVVHFRSNIKYSQKKLWYIASMIRGMSVDEAIKQLSFYKRKGAAVVKEVIQEAQDMAVQDHNVEFRSNLWIEASFIRKAKTLKGQRRRALRGPGLIHYRYTHYFLRLREGRPPKHYYPPPPTGNEILHEYLKQLRERRIINAL